MKDCPDRLFHLILALTAAEGPYNARNWRNNNPCNLKFANQPGAISDPHGFARFQTLVDGFLAARRQIELDAKRHPEWTLLDLSNSWAPPSDPANFNHAKNLRSALAQFERQCDLQQPLSTFLAP